MHRIKLITIIIIIMLMANLSVGCGNKSTTTTSRQTPVEICLAEKGDIQVTYSVSGLVKAFKEIPILPKAPGRVEQTFKDIGDTISKDEILFSLDKKDLHRQLQQIEAQVASSNTNHEMAELSLERASGSAKDRQVLQAESGLNQARAGLSQAEEGINRAESAVKQVEIGLQQIEKSYNNIKSDYEKNQSLYKVGAISEQILNNYKHQLEAIELEYNATKENYSNLKESYNIALMAYENSQETYKNAQENYNIIKDKVIDEDIKGAKLQINQAKDASQITQAQKGMILDAINDSNVRSPINGIIAGKTIENGIFANQQIPSYTVVDIDKVIIETSVTERMINKIEKGQEVLVTIKAIEGKQFEGIIDSLSPASVEQKIGYTVKIIINNKDHEIKPGMFAEVNFIIENKNEILSIPVDAVINEDMATYIYVLEGDIAKKRKIQLGLKDENNYEIIEGLIEGEKVITKGQHFINDNESVRVVGGDKNEDI